jgi:mono/diheme cytochrome c family protein
MAGASVDTKSQFLPQQPLVLLVALLLWALAGSATWLAIITCYLLALVLVNLVVVWFPAALVVNPATSGQRRLFYGLLLIAALSIAGRLIFELQPTQTFSTLRENVADRLALERTPAIAPALLVAYEPQRFTIYAPGSKGVGVRWASSVETKPTIDLGHGVFLFEFDPRSEPALEKVQGSEIACAIIADGAVHQRTLNFVRPQAHPRQIDSAPALGLAVTVSEETDELFIIRRDGSCLRIAVGDGPTDCKFVADGQRIVVAHRYSPELWLVNAVDGSVHARLPSVLGQTRLATSADGKWLALAIQGVQPAVRIFALPEMKEAQTLPLPFSPDLLAFANSAEPNSAETNWQLIVTDRRERAVHRIAKGDASWTLLEPPLFFPRPIFAMSKTPVANQLALATTASHLTYEQLHANHFIENTIHTLDVAAWQIAATQVTDRRGLRQDSPGDTEHGVSPLALAVIDKRLFAAFAGSNEVAEVTSNGVATTYLSLDSYPLFGPQGLGDLGAGHWCVTSPIDGSVGVFDQAGTLQTLIELAPTEESLAKADSVALARRQGERTFFETTRAGIACQSCHLDSATDFCLHDIGQGKPVDVLSVRGIIGTSPYLRDASHWRLQELHDVAAVGYRDYPRPVPWDRAKSLAAYLNSLPLSPHPRLGEKLDLPRMKAGVTAFFVADCATCHTPPAFTNLGQHSAAGLFPEYYGSAGPAAGTDDFLDTPSLRGIALTAPYLHDGRARTLRAVLTDWNRTSRHGNVQLLTSGQLEDLLYFLERL